MPERGRGRRDLVSRDPESFARRRGGASGRSRGREPECRGGGAPAAAVGAGEDGFLAHLGDAGRGPPLGSPPRMTPEEGPGPLPGSYGRRPRVYRTMRRRNLLGPIPKG